MIKKVISITLVLAMCTGIFSACKSNDSTENEEPLSFDTLTATASKTITIDGSKASTAENTLYDGLGMVSANNSSRLLLDYKSENPDAYWELLNYLYGEDGMNLSLIKIEMGADIDSSSGTEPAVKRTEDETADVTRGAGYQLAADAKTINPDIDVDLIYWGKPAWVADAEDVNEATYQWYKQTIDALYDTYGVKVTYLTATQNEKTNDTELIKYIAKALDEETDERYDYGTIKIVAGEGVCVWNIADMMLEDSELMEAVDVISAHYTSFTSDSAKKLQDEYGKQVWFSEGSSPMSYSEETYNYDGTGSGMSDINGMLDIATRITQAMTEGMTMYEFQPAISAYYDGVTYFPKQLITANEPWSGNYELGTGYYMVMQFNQFIKKGWNVIDEACFGDGVAGGDGHAIVDSTYNYVTCTDSEKKDFSTVIVNNSSETIEYTLDVSNIENAGENLYVWESRGPDESSTDYYDNFFKKLGHIEADDSKEGISEYKVVVKPYSMITVSSLDVEVSDETKEIEESEVLALGYEDDFEYSNYDAEYLASRGMAPRYTTDQGGAFEVAAIDGNNVLEQKVTYDNMPQSWGGISVPITNLGDDRWSNYTVSVDAHFATEEAETDKVNYLGVGARYNLADSNQSGYWLKLYSDGKCELMQDNTVLDESQINDLDVSAWHNIKITAVENKVICTINDATIFEYEAEGQFVNSGRIALYSDFQMNYFDNIKVEPVDGTTSYITRLDDLDSALVYSAGSNSEEGEGWYFNTMSSFKNYNRTVSTGETGDSVTITVQGKAFAVIGSTVQTSIKVEVNGKVVEENLAVKATAGRQAIYKYSDLIDGDNTVKITVTEGTLMLDAIEITK